MILFLVSQVLVSGTFLLGITAFQARHRVRLLRLMSVGMCLYAAHFFLLGAPDAGAICCVTALRYLTASIRRDPRLLVVFLIATLVAFRLAPQRPGPIGLLALGAALLGTVGSFQADVVRLRILTFCCSSIWCVHNWLVGSWVGFLMEASFATSNAIGWLRHRGAR